jgi:hypothetical protein
MRDDTRDFTADLGAAEVGTDDQAPETVVPATEAERENFLECACSPFSERVARAAMVGRLRAGPLVDSLSRIQAISRGLQTIFRIAHTNAVQQSAWDDRDADDEGTQPPMAPNTIESLLVLGDAVSGMIVGDIEHISEWADKHGVMEH